MEDLAVRMGVDNNDYRSQSPPISPIVGYDIHTEDEISSGASSSSTDSETEQCLAQMNAQLAKMINKTLTPEPETKASATRRRIRKRRYREMQEELRKSDVEGHHDDPTNKRRKIGVVKVEQKQLFPPAEFEDNLPSPQPTKQGQSYVPSPKPGPAPITLPPQAIGFLGFKTASGKNVEISEAAWKKALAMEKGDGAEKGVDPTIDKSKTLTKPLLPQRLSFSPAMRLGGFAKQMSTPFKPPTRIRPRLAIAPLTRVGVEVPRSLPPPAPTPTGTVVVISGADVKLGKVDSGMTQEVMDAIEAFLEDEDEDGDFPS